MSKGRGSLSPDFDNMNLRPLLVAPSPQADTCRMGFHSEITDLNPAWLAGVRARSTDEGTMPRVLVVHAERNLRELLKLHLVTAGYAVTSAADAVEAGKEVVRHAPDLIVLDVRMPYMDGVEFVSALRSDPGMALIPVIFLTCDDESHARAERLGAAACLTTPLYADVFLKTVSRVLSAPAIALGAGIRPARSSLAA